MSIPRVALGSSAAVLTAMAVIVGPLPAFAAAPAPANPEIRLNPGNTVPACVTPERLMAFIRTRNETLDPRFADIARWYKHHGAVWHVRWDYAFFQMVVETNYLQFKRGDGHPGDVKPRQNNFAGIGTTGGGVPGDSYPDVKTGVLAHIQHLVAYSGERLAQPVAPRTQLKQNDIVEVSLKLGRPVRFSDLARRWAVDRHYGASIAAVAERYQEGFCTSQQVTLATVEPPQAGSGGTSHADRPAQPPRSTARRRAGGGSRDCRHAGQNRSAVAPTFAGNVASRPHWLTGTHAVARRQRPAHARSRPHCVGDRASGRHSVSWPNRNGAHPGTCRHGGGRSHHPRHGSPAHASTCGPARRCTDSAPAGRTRAGNRNCGSSGMQRRQRQLRRQEDPSDQAPEQRHRRIYRALRSRWLRAIDDRRLRS